MNAAHEIFLSIVVVVENQQKNLEQILVNTSNVARQCSSEHEIVVVDNGSKDGSVDLLRSLCGEDGIANLQVYCLAKKVEKDVAAWAGVENALGDYVAVIDPTEQDIGALPDVLAASMGGADVVFGASRNPSRESIVYRIASSMFSVAVKRLLAINPKQEMPFFRVLSRKVINYMLQHEASGLSYRWLPATSGFRKATVTYDSSIQPLRRNVFNEIDRGIRLLVSSSFGPMRLVTTLSLFGAAMNLLYSLYVIAVALFKEDVAPGWVTLSLQQSGMFFLFSLVLLVVGEYVLHMAQLASHAPSYYVTDEFSSAVISRQKRLNVEVSVAENSAGVLNEPANVIDGR